MSDFYANLNHAQLHLQAYESSYNVGANTSVVQANVWIERNGFSPYNLNNNSWSDNIDGQGQSGSGAMDLRSVSSQLLLSGSFTIAHNSDGTRTISVSASYSPNGGTNVNAGTASGSLGLTTIPRAPGAPSFNSITNVTASAFDANYTAPSNIGGSAITGYTMQISTDATFATGVTTVGPSLSNPLHASGLTAFTLYNVRIKATNTQGDSPWSATRTVTMAASGAPHLAVTPKWDNSGILIICSPPFGVSAASVTGYKVTRTVTGPGAPAPVVLAVPGGAGAGFLTDAFVLATGQTASYQAVATVAAVDTGPSGSVSTSYSAIAIRAPYPILLIGSNPAPAPLSTTELVAWTGTADASSTTVVGRHPKGWRKFSEGKGLSDAVGVVTQIDKSLGIVSVEGALDVMAIFANAQTVAGFRLGTSITGAALMIPVFGTIPYFGSIVTRVDVQTRLACEIEWYGSDGSLLARSQGAAQVVPADTVTTLTANDTAPSDAAYAAVNVVDVTGTGWAAGSLRYAGSVMLSASVLLPFYDGDTTDDPNYQYSWMGTTNASASLRVANTAAAVLVDPNQPVIPSPPTAPAVEEAAVGTDVVWRRYVAAIPAASILEFIRSIPTLSLTALVNTEREVRIRYWENPGNISPTIWTDAGAEMISEQIVTYIPGGSTFTIDGLSERAWVVYTGDTQQIAADQFLFGEGGGPVEWPALDCGVAVILTLDVPVTSVPNNIVPALNLTNRIL